MTDKERNAIIKKAVEAIWDDLNSRGGFDLYMLASYKAAAEILAELDRLKAERKEPA